MAGEGTQVRTAKPQNGKAEFSFAVLLLAV
jgi:hypothetical protein